MIYSIGFILEQALGHITHSQNLMRSLAGDPSIQAQWGLPVFAPQGLAARLPVIRSNWTVRAGMQTRRILREMHAARRPDALFFHTQVTATLVPDWLERIPSVVSLDATPIQYDSLGAAYAHRPGPAAVERLKWRLNRDCFRKARRIVAWSQWAKDGLVADYEAPAEKITVIPPGVTVEEWTPPVERSPHAGVRILFVGGDLERKGGQTLLEAFRRLKRRLAAAGGALELHLVTRRPVPAEAGVFAYHDIQPNTPELKRLFFDSDIFCLPTLGDCLPMALAEAGAAGLPIISTRVGAIPEIVRDGETGFLVQPGDPDGLAARLEALICDAGLRTRLGAGAAQVIRSEHDASVNAGRLVALLKQTVDENRPRKSNP